VPLNADADTRAKLGPASLTPVAVPWSKEARMKSKVEVLAELRTMLADVFAAKASGEAYGRLARAHGYVDGYMRALLDLGMVTKAELLEVVNAERERSSGPAMRPMADLAASASASASAAA